MKNIVVFLLGAAIGGAGVYFYMKKKEEDYINQEVESIRNYYESTKTEKKKTILTEDDISKLAEESRNKPDVVDYARFYAEPGITITPSPDITITPAIIKTDEDKDVKTPRTPKLIKKETFYNDGMYNKVALSYYVFNKVLFNEDDGEVVTNPEELIGDALTEYGFDESEEEVIRVRNFETMTDYEIEKLFASYK